MYLYAEVWNTRPAWLALSIQERTDYMTQLGPVISELLAAGVECVGWAVNDTDTPYRADYQYLAVWKMPDKSLVERLESVVEQSGWHRYFEQVNIRGVLTTPQTVIGDMISR